MIGIVNYQANNLRSVANALKAIGAEFFIADEPARLAKATAIVLPGVGAFSDSMTNLRRLGFIEPLQQAVRVEKKPVLGLCLGMQLMAEKSFEFGEHEGLGWLQGTVEKIEPNDQSFRVPHMGWNNLEHISPASMLLQSIVQPAVVYFVHSYYFKPVAGAEAVVTSTVSHGLTLTATVEKDYIFGCQFHPEKSQQAGLLILQNFVEYTKQHA